MHQIMCICNARDLHQHVINFNSGENHQKPPLSTFLITNVKTTKTSNIKEEKNHYSFNFCLKWHSSYEVLKIRQEVKIHKCDRRKNFTQGSALKAEWWELKTQGCFSTTVWRCVKMCEETFVRLRRQPLPVRAEPQARGVSVGDGLRGSQARAWGQNRKHTKTTLH